MKLVAAPGPVQNLEGLHIKRLAVLPSLAEHLEFIGHVARADDHLQAATAQVLDYRQILGQLYRIVQGRQQYIGANGDVAGHRPDGAGHRDGGRQVAILGGVVFSQPYRVEAKAVSPAAHVECCVENGLPGCAEVRCAHVEADNKFHLRLPWSNDSEG